MHAIELPTTETALVCQECGGSKEVYVYRDYWSCGGRNCFSFEWHQVEATGDGDAYELCYECSDKYFDTCDHCGAEIKTECVVMETKCPACKKPLSDHLA